MPNHVQNILTIEGEKANEILQSLKGTDGENEGDLIDFSKVKPMPECLENTVNPSRCPVVDKIIREEFNPELSDDDIERKVVERLLSTKEVLDGDLKERLALFREAGAFDWYDWRINNWGTKWNAYDTYEMSDTAVGFQTAWSTPERFIHALSEKYPDNTFTVKYADEDIGSNCGRYVYKSGERIEDWYPEGDKATSYAKEIWAYDDYDYDEDE